MSAGKFKFSYPASVQMAMLPAGEKAALTRLFSSSNLESPPKTKRTADGRFVSRVGQKRVLWRKMENNLPEILAIVDKSYAEAG